MALEAAECSGGPFWRAQVPVSCPCSPGFPPGSCPFLTLSLCGWGASWSYSGQRAVRRLLSLFGGCVIPVGGTPAPPQGALMRPREEMLRRIGRWGPFPRRRPGQVVRTQPCDTNRPHLNCPHSASSPAHFTACRCGLAVSLHRSQCAVEWLSSS